MSGLTMDPIVGRELRKKPFTRAEKLFLTALVSRKPILENKCTNMVASQAKRRAWESLCAEFNARAFTHKRHPYQLTKCWRNMQQQRRRQQAADGGAGAGARAGSPRQEENRIEFVCPGLEEVTSGTLNSGSVEGNGYDEEVVKWEMEDTPVHQKGRERRKVPFTRAEKSFLTALVSRRPILENKCTNMAAAQAKRRAWESLCAEFNARSFTHKRHPYQLTKCWRNMQQQRRRQQAADGGPGAEAGAGSPRPEENRIEFVCPGLEEETSATLDPGSMEGNGYDEEGKWEMEDAPVHQEDDKRKVSSMQGEAAARLRRVLNHTKLEEELMDIRIKRERVTLQREQLLLQHDMEEFAHRSRIRELELKKAKQELEPEKNQCSCSAL